MSQVTDMYTLLRFYANRIRSPKLPINQFIQFLEKYAKHYAAERPDIAPYAQETGRQVWVELPKLEQAGKIQIITDETGTSIEVPQYYSDLIQGEYKTADDAAELPFPDEHSLRIKIPENRLLSLRLESDLSALMAAPEENGRAIIKLEFSETLGSMLLLSSMVPRRLLELALLKIRHYLRSHNNKDYIQHKLAPAFQGRESMLKDALNQLMVRPFDTLSELENAGDFSFPFWTYFIGLVKGDIRKKNDLLPEDIAALQSVLIIEVMNNFYKGKISRAKEEELAFKNLDLQLYKQPFLYTIDDIVSFKDTKGIPLLGQYSQEGLEKNLKDLTTNTENDQLPELLIIHGSNGERWFVKKAKILPLCIKLLGEVRPKIKVAISQRWFKEMKNYQNEKAMEDDTAFEKLLWELTAGTSPPLISLLEDKKLYLIHEEMESSGTGIPQVGRLFFKGMLAPMSDLLLLKRKDLLTDVRMLLPFWYSVPILLRIITFFKGTKKSKTKQQSHSHIEKRQEEIQTQKAVNTAPVPQPKKDRKKELKQTARKLQNQLVPQGYTAETFRTELLDRWNRLINVQAKKNLTEDVNSLIRDYLRKTIRAIRTAPFTPERITELANTLADSPNLQKLPERDALQLYIQIYITQLLMKI